MSEQLQELTDRLKELFAQNCDCVLSIRNSSECSRCWEIGFTESLIESLRSEKV